MAFARTISIHNDQRYTPQHTGDWGRNQVAMQDEYHQCHDPVEALGLPADLKCFPGLWMIKMPYGHGEVKRIPCTTMGRFCPRNEANVAELHCLPNVASHGHCWNMLKHVGTAVRVLHRHE